MVGKILVGSLILMVGVIIGAVLFLSAVADMIELTMETAAEKPRTSLLASNSGAAGPELVVEHDNSGYWPLRPTYNPQPPTYNPQRSQ